MPGKTWTKEELAIVEEHYYKNPKIYTLLPNRTRQSVNYKAWQLGIKVDGRGEALININYFNKWTPNMAWILGFLVADGNIFSKSYYGGAPKYIITFTQKEKDILIAICNELNIPHKFVRKLKGTVTLPQGGTAEQKCHKVTFTNKVIYQRLVELGVMPNKSLQIRKLPVPKKYFQHFLRGYFDGDGCFSWSTEPRQRTPRVSFTSGSRQFLKWIEAKISKYFQMPKGRLRKKPKGAWTLRYRKRCSLKLMGIMYFDKDASLFIKRKKDSFQNYLNYHGIDLSAHETPEARVKWFSDLVKI